MEHEYETQPEEVVIPEILEHNLDSDSEIKAEKQDSEGSTTEQVGKIDSEIKAPEGDILEERDEALPPKVDAETVTVIEGVSKQIIKEGYGRGPPPRHSSCFGTPYDSQAFFSSLFG